MARKIVVTSGKGGVGKTTVCANLGVKLASLGFKTVMIDADMGLNNLDVVMGVENRIMFDLMDIVDGRCRVKQALLQDKRFPSLYVLTSSHSYNRTNATGEDMKKIVDELEQTFDYILIDCPAGVEMGFHRAVFSVDEAIVVVTPHISSIRDADKVISILASYNIDKKYLIVNRARGDMVLNGEMIDIEEIVSFLKIPIIGIIPDDDDISSLSSIGAFTNNNLSGRAFTLLAENVHNGSRKLYDYTMKYRGLWGGIKRSLKRKV